MSSLDRTNVHLDTSSRHADIRRLRMSCLALLLGNLLAGSILATAVDEAPSQPVSPTEKPAPTEDVGLAVVESASPDVEVKLAPPQLPQIVLNHAADLLKKFDANGDGRLDRTEWGRMKEAPTSGVFNGSDSVDGRKLAEQMIGYYARLIEIRENKLQLGQDPIPYKILNHARRVVTKYDRDADGRLQPAEWGRMQCSPCWADSDCDGTVTLEELGELLTHYGERRKIRLVPPPALASDSPPRLFHAMTDPESPDERGTADATSESDEASAAVEPPPATADGYRNRRMFAARLPAGLPDWFDRRDLNGDGQLTIPEYAPNRTKATLAQFVQLDANRDGVLTAREYLRSARTPATTSGD